MEYNKLCLGCFRENNSGSPVCPFCGFVEKEYNKKALEKMWLPAGSILQGRYLIGKTLGAGGFGITYIAYQLNLDRVVAIKEFFLSNITVRGELTHSTGMDLNVKVSGARSRELFMKYLTGFEKEGRTLAHINLPGVVGIYDCFRENSTAYIVMEYIEGQNLKEYQKNRGGKIEEKELLELLEPVIQSLSTIHEAGIIHRDISPDNMIRNSKGKLILVDFGAARSIAGLQDGDGKSMTVVLKHGYAPLEQYDVHGNQGPWTDVYALCATMYRLLTGKTPDTVSTRVEQDSTGEEIGKKLIEAGASVKTSDAIAKGMRIQSSKRTQNMSELWKALYADDPSHFTHADDRLYKEGAEGNGELDQEQSLKRTLKKLRVLLYYEKYDQVLDTYRELTENGLFIDSIALHLSGLCAMKKVHNEHLLASSPEVDLDNEPLFQMLFHLNSDEEELKLIEKLLHENKEARKQRENEQTSDSGINGEKGGETVKKASSDLLGKALNERYKREEEERKHGQEDAERKEEDQKKREEEEQKRRKAEDRKRDGEKVRDYLQQFLPAVHQAAKTGNEISASHGLVKKALKEAGYSLSDDEKVIGLIFLSGIFTGKAVVIFTDIRCCINLKETVFPMIVVQYDRIAETQAIPFNTNPRKKALVIVLKNGSRMGIANPSAAMKDVIDFQALSILLNEIAQIYS